MGRMGAEGFASAVEDGSIGLESALRWHLGSNHYPPVLFMLDVALEAIEVANNDEWDFELAMPDGVSYKGRDFITASEAIRELHLEEFLS